MNRQPSASISHWSASRLAQRARQITGALFACLLFGCGGGSELAGGVGSGGSGVAEGLVTGFGSVIVDGVPYDDTAALISVEDDAAQRQPTSLALGQRVRMTLNEAGRATAIEVLPALLGPVTAAVQGDWLRVAAQWVRLERATLLLDLADTDQLVPGAEVEVHGTWQSDDTRGAVLVASMLRPRQGPAGASVLVGGVVHRLVGRTATLGTAQGTALTLPPGAPLPAVGDIAAWWVPRDALVPRDSVLNAGGSGPWPTLRQRQSLAAAEGLTWVLGGAVGVVEGRRLSVEGVQVDWPDAAGLPVPQRGDTVRVTLRRVGERWDVQRAEVRDQPTKLGGYVELRGSVTGIDWNIRPLELTLRGVRVAISDDVLTSSGCSGAGPLSLEIVAARGRLPLRALALSCSLPPPGI